MNRKVQFFIALSLCSVVLLPSSDRPLTFLESAFAGGIAGVGEVASSGQPLSRLMAINIRNAAIKNSEIAEEKFIFSQSYKGFFAHAGGQMPIIAIQNVVKEKGSQFLQSRQKHTLTDSQKAMISFAAGISGAVIDTPSNAIQLFLQNQDNKGKSFTYACKKLGMKKCFRGFGPNAFLKEGPFAVGYQFLFPKLTELAQKCIDDEWQAKCVGGIGAGVSTAIVTQAGAVMRNMMQEDARYALTSTLQTAQRIYSQEGYKGFFVGLHARGLRIAIAIPLLTEYTKLVEKFIKE